MEDHVKIQVRDRSVYGNDLIYPVCELAKTFAQLVNRKTLTASDLHFIAKLGYAIERPTFTNKES